MKRKRICIFQNVRGSKIKGTKNRKNLSGSKWKGPNCPKKFQDRSGTKQIVPNFFKIEVEQTKMFQNRSMFRWKKMNRTACGVAWRLDWIRGKEALMDVPDRDSPSLV